MSANSDSLSLIEQALDRNPVTMAPDTNLKCAIATMSASRSSYVLAVQQQKILGIFTERDVVRLSTDNICPDTPLSQVMTPNPIAISLEEARDIFNLLALLRLSKIRHLPITDPAGNLIGMITGETLRTILKPTDLLRMRRVAEIMTPHVLSSSTNLSVLEIVQLMATESKSCVVICLSQNSDATPYGLTSSHGIAALYNPNAHQRPDNNKQKPIGILTERDIVRFQATGLDFQTPASTVMSCPLLPVKQDASLWDAHELMQQHRIRRLVVVDREGYLAGIVTQSTLLQALDPVEMYATVELLQRTIGEKTQQLRQANEQMQREVTQRRQIQEQLRQTKENLEAEVAARTLEITATNKQLQQALLERISAEAEVRRLNAELEHRVQERTAQLANSNQELQQILAHLQATQQELIQSEKMAALGQLIAGIAHEINTPLGAIRSSVQNIADFLEQNLERLPEFFQQLSPQRYADFFALLRQAIAQPDNFSAKEKRQFKKILRSQLEACQIEDADTIADTLVDLGVYQDIAPFVPLLKSEGSGAILKTAYQLTTLQKSTQTIRTATDWAAKMISALRNYARFDNSGEKVRSQITDGIDTVLTIYHNAFKPGVNLTKNYQSNLPAIFCYPDELNQVWTNLIHNALQAMNYQGELAIEVTTRDSWIIVSITDSGTGVPPEIVPRIFEPFFTTKPPGEGSGLGLEIVKKIIDKHGGQITVESSPGKTTFSVFLPSNSNKEEADV
jgi:signal transduction histidine kinase